MNKVPRKVWKRLEKSGKPQSEFCTNPVSISLEPVLYFFY